MALNIGGPHRGHAAGDTDVEKQASQLASDVKLKVKKKMGSHTNMNPAQVAQAYERQLASSPAPSMVKALARKKLKIGVSEQYEIGELAKKSAVNAFNKVFVEGIEKKDEDLVESQAMGEKKYWIVVTDKQTGNTYRRRATRAEISELRANPNIRKVEMTAYHPKENDDKQGQKTARVKAGKGLDPVGKEDPKGDVDNDGIPASRDKNDKYLLKRRAAVGNAIASRSRGTQKEEFLGEVKKSKKKSTDTITGEGVNNSKYINVKPTMEQSEPVVDTKKPENDEKEKIKLRQKQVQFALNRQRQTMQLQRSGRLPLNYSEDNTQEGDDIQEVAPPGFEGTVKAMKKYPELSKGKTSEGKDKNIYALAWFMKNKGYKSHKTKSGADKEVQKSHYEPEGEMIGEEESDRINDRRLERGGVGAGRGSTKPQKPAKPMSDAERKSADERRREISRQAIAMVMAKHGGPKNFM
jgi:hypothetical protein